MAEVVEIDPIMYGWSNRKSMAASSCVRFPPHFRFRFGRKWLSVVDFRPKCAVRRPLVTGGPSRTVSEVGRRQISVLPVLVRLEVVSSVKIVADRPIHSIGVEQEVDGCEFIFPVSAIFPLSV